MNTTKGGSSNGKGVTRAKRVIHNPLKQARAGLSIHPVLLDWAKERAMELGYEGGLSGYLAGLVLFDLIARRKHWLTVEIANNPDQLEATLKELKNQPPENWGTWIEAKLREINISESEHRPAGDAAR